MDIDFSVFDFAFEEVSFEDIKQGDVIAHFVATASRGETVWIGTAESLHGSEWWGKGRYWASADLALGKRWSQFTFDPREDLVVVADWHDGAEEWDQKHHIYRVIGWVTPK